MPPSDRPTAPPTIDDDRALEVSRVIAEHDEALRNRGVDSSNLLRALALGEDFAAESFDWR
jgi:hypothetical protein